MMNEIGKITQLLAFFVFLKKSKVLFFGIHGFNIKPVIYNTNRRLLTRNKNY